MNQFNVWYNFSLPFIPTFHPHSNRIQLIIICHLHWIAVIQVGVSSYFLWPECKHATEKTTKDKLNVSTLIQNINAWIFYFRNIYWNHFRLFLSNFWLVFDCSWFFRVVCYQQKSIIALPNHTTNLSHNWSDQSIEIDVAKWIVRCWTGILADQTQCVCVSTFSLLA